MKRGVIITLAVLALMAVSYLAGRHRAVGVVVDRVDTVTVVKVDTVMVDSPVYVERRVVDTQYLAVDVERIIRDTVTDTVIIELDREQRRYGDSTYTAWVSGVEPRLDSLRIYNRTYHQIVTHTEYRNRRLSFGVQGGAGVVSPFGGSPTAGWYVGLGLTYRIW